MNYTVRVMGQALFICLGTRNLSRYSNVSYLLVLVQKFYCDGAREKNFMILLVLICKLFAKALE